jgi:hypothetical protein
MRHRIRREITVEERPFEGRVLDEKRSTRFSAQKFAQIKRPLARAALIFLTPNAQSLKPQR